MAENNLLNECSLKVSEYKCFGEKEQGFEKIIPINIIIGKNNSGKSSLIDLVENLIISERVVQTATFDGQRYLEFSIKENFINNVANRVARKKFPHMRGIIPSLDGIINTLNPILDSKIKLINRNIVESHDLVNNGAYTKEISEEVIVHTNQFSSLIFKRINAERDINATTSLTDIINFNSIEPNGDGATNIIRGIINSSDFHPDIVQDKLFNKFKEIVEPDIQFTNIYAQTISSQHNTWEIYFKDKRNNMIPLSKMGSGVKTILMVLINLIVLPEITNDKKKSDFVFGFEELENNLHPALQRRLFNYIAEYAKEHNCHFFITTHSSMVIDMFSYNPLAQILHVENDGTNATVKTIETYKDGKNVLTDMGFKASDILLSNGVIWVEGPSDAIYIEMLLALYDTQNNVGLNKLNYTIQVLSTAIWKYAGFDEFDWDKIENENLQNQIISLMKLNHNHLIVIDNDGNYEDKLPSAFDTFKNGNGKNKASLMKESMLNSNQKEEELTSNSGNYKENLLSFWINEGTFETCLEYYVTHKGKDDFEKYFSTNKSLGFFEKKREGENSSISKVVLAANISVKGKELSFEDFTPKGSALEDKIFRLFNTIKSWNA